MKHAKKISFALALWLTLGQPILHGEDAAPAPPTVYSLDATEDASLWYMAFEEAGFIRSHIGDWICVALYRSAPNSVISWHLKKAHRKANECTLEISLTGSGGKEVLQQFHWFDKGPDGDMRSTVSNDRSAGNAYVTFVQEDGSTRRLWIRRSRDLEELSRSVKVTRAQPLWDWKVATVSSL